MRKRAGYARSMATGAPRRAQARSGSFPGEGERRGFLVVHLGLWEPTTSTFRASLAWAAVITKPQTALIEIRGGRKLAEKPA